MPWDLTLALGHAVMILSWFEHIPEEDMPPRWMWPISDALEEHFTDVKERRSSGRSRETDEIDGPAMTNEYARRRGRNAR